MKCFLLDGPLMTTIERRKAVTVAMAKTLGEAGVPDTERDTVRLLLARGFHHLDVALLVPDARALAYQEIVAREMGEP